MGTFVGLLELFIVGLVWWLFVRMWRQRKVSRWAGAAVIAGFVGIIAFFVMLALSLDKVFRSARTASARSGCERNLQEIGKALIIYMRDNDDRTPLANWSDGIKKYTDPRNFACPLLGPYGYTFSKEAINIETESILSPAMMIVAFDGVGGKNSVGMEGDIRWRHPESAVFLYLDGRVKGHDKRRPPALSKPTE